jgi:hypothetical protein
VFVPAGQAGPVLAAARQIGEVERDRARRIGEGQTLRQQTAFDDLPGPAPPTRPSPSGSTCAAPAQPSRSRSLPAPGFPAGRTNNP